MDAIANLIGYIKGFFNWLKEFFTETIVSIAIDGINWLIVKLTVLYIDAKIMSVKFAWGIAKTVLETLNIGPVISSYVATLDSTIAYAANTIGLFDGFNMIINAMLSSFILKFVRV